jgi:hypothetical protein
MDLSIRVFPLEPGGNKNLVRGIGPGHATADPSQNALCAPAATQTGDGLFKAQSFPAKSARE